MMAGIIDFSIAPATGAALLAGPLMPLYLAFIARISQLRGKNAVQFLVAFFVMTMIWAGMVFPHAQRIIPTDILVGIMILGSSALFYLEIWALLSRGYTLGLILTLFYADKPLNPEALAGRYRSGAGLEWIMTHRVTGLDQSGLVQIQNENVRLTAMGAFFALAYKITIAVLGLRKTG